jgi:hypothetical protein
MTDFELTPDEVEAPKANRPLTIAEIAEIEAKASKLDQVGYGYAVERFLSEDLTESDLKAVRYLYDQAEREAALRGEKWEAML